MSGSFAKTDLQLKGSYGSSPPCKRLVFPQKSSMIGGSFAKNDLQLKGSYGSSMGLHHPVRGTCL